MVLTTRRQARLQEVVDISTPTPPSERAQSAPLDEGSERGSEASSSSSKTSGSESSSENDEQKSSSDSDSVSDSGNEEDDDDIDVDSIFAEALKACQARDENATTRKDHAFETSADQISLGQQRAIEAPKAIEASKEQR